MLTRLDLTPANRPQLLPDETLLFVQSNVGLYEGKQKIPNYQDGFTYLTTHRACYVDSAHPRTNSVAVLLKDVDRVEPYAGFLKSSPKITLYLKPDATSDSPVGYSSSPVPGRSGTPLIREATPEVPLGTWICTICSFSNPFPSNYAPASPITPPCQSCGIKPTQEHLAETFKTLAPPPPPTPANTLPCPRCTFHNHPSLPFCELCATPLQTLAPAPQPSPFPSLTVIKFSFRAGGHTTFLSHLRTALIQRKWLLQTAPPIPRAPSPPPISSTPGVGGLELSSNRRREKNAASISTAFSDLESLMSCAKEMVRLAESLSRVNAGSATSAAEQALRKSTEALALVGKAETVGGQSAWIDELARQVAEFLVAGDVLRREGGIITLVDLWAIFNRARAGIDLVSPKDLTAAVERFEALKLPVRTKKFGSGIRVVQERGLGDEEVGRRVLEWVGWGRGVTAREAAERWGWSLGVATEELEMVEGRGGLCREVGVGGVRWWRNRFLERGWETEVGSGESGRVVELEVRGEGLVV